jgi:hypothetical protein
MIKSMSERGGLTGDATGVNLMLRIPPSPAE